MDAAIAVPNVRFNRFLPYWAVLRTDIRTVLRSWAFWLWVCLFVVISAGHVIYRYALAKTGYVADQNRTALTAAAQTSYVIQVVLSASLAVITFLSVSSISSERATVADAVLSRGISRRSYFLAKWHARMVTVLGTFMLLSLGLLFVYTLLLGDGSVVEQIKTVNADGTTTVADKVIIPGVSFLGSLLGVIMIAAGLAVVVSAGVSIGAISNGTLFGITIAWVLLYGGLSVTTLLPEGYPTPSLVLGRLSLIMQGQYDMAFVGRVLGYSALASVCAAAVGLIAFDRKDV
jgi:hypothetical protein